MCKDKQPASENEALQRKKEGRAEPERGRRGSEPSGEVAPFGAQLAKGRDVYDAGLRRRKLRPADPFGIESVATGPQPSGGACREPFGELQPSARGRLRAAALPRAFSRGSKPAERAHDADAKCGPPQAGGCGPPIPYGIKPFGSKLRPADPSRDRNRSAADHDPPTAAPPNRSSGKGARRPAAPVFSRNAPLLKCFIFNFACFHAPPSSARSLFGNDAHGFQQIFTIFAGLNHR